MTTALYETRIAHATACGHFSCSLAAWVRGRWRAERTRTELNNMTDVELKDIGLSRGEIGVVANGRYRR
ncbi:MAG: DUF1127 domain-containing protein [Pseudolabrys sp.]|nr:DUF1127 domain-containing protein [Pseudolabrys sp.]MDP2294111.1 DUF1127 domain-containing protein [Pseudolabrys sp.]